MCSIRELKAPKRIKKVEEFINFNKPYIQVQIAMTPHLKQTWWVGMQKELEWFAYHGYQVNPFQFSNWMLIQNYNPAQIQFLVDGLKQLGLAEEFS